MVRVGINGFGEMGRYLVRANFLDELEGIRDPGKIEIVAANDLSGLENMTRNLAFSSIYGNFPADVNNDGKNIFVDGKEVVVSSESDPNNLNWKELGVDVVYEATGVFTKPSTNPEMMDMTAQYLADKAGAQKIVFSAPSKHDGVVTIVMGVNDEVYNGQDLLSNASCTTNCLAPVAYVLEKEFGLEVGYMDTIHAFTGDQRLIDSPHSDPRRGYSTDNNLIPTKTGAAAAIGLVIPELEGKLSGRSIRTDNPTGSLVHLVAGLRENPSSEEVNAAMEQYANGQFDGTLKYSTDDLVSRMVWGERSPSIYDSKSTEQVGGLTSVVIFYDNIAGFSHQANKMMEMLGGK